MALERGVATFSACARGRITHLNQHNVCAREKFQPQGVDYPPESAQLALGTFRASHALPTFQNKNIAGRMMHQLAAQLYLNT